MALITRCPGCGTAFRVTPLDLQAHGGDVRCGRCAHIFSGYASLAKVREPESAGPAENEETEEIGQAEAALAPGSPVVEEPDTSNAEKRVTTAETTAPSGNLEVPLVSGHPERRGHPESAGAAQTVPEEDVGSASPFASASSGHFGLDAGEKKTGTEDLGAGWVPSPDVHTAERSETFYGTRQEELSPPFDEVQGATPESLDKQYLAPQDDAYNPAHPLPDFLAWGIASIFLLFTLAAQTVYAYRAEISAMAPGARLYIEQYCKLLQCGIPSAPQYAKLLNIESSDMQADPQRQGINALTALVRNYASYPQAYPLVQLTLIDAQDRPLASRTFPPPAYLERDVDFVEPVAPNGEFNIGLHIDSGDLNAAGYRLLLLYPAS